MKIAVEEDEEPWEELIDDIDNDTLKDIDTEVDENYIQSTDNN